VEEREVGIHPAGVTVVQGPNEAGKSSLIEAIDAIFGSPG
jgi:AAA15 family ATPase/GTPase